MNNVVEASALLARGKELSRLHDQVAPERRALPWLRVDKSYVFEEPEGKRTLADLFEGRRFRPADAGARCARVSATEAESRSSRGRRRYSQREQYQRG